MNVIIDKKQVVKDLLDKDCFEIKHTKRCSHRRKLFEEGGYNLYPCWRCHMNDELAQEITDIYESTNL